MRTTHTCNSVLRCKRWLPLLILAGLVVLLFGACSDSVSSLFAAQDKTYASKSKSVNAPTRPIPGGNTTVDAAGLAKIIDDEISLRLQKEKLVASPKTEDAEFIRRVYLDLVGVIPAVEKVTAFLSSTESDKRAKLIDELLADPFFGKQLSEIWMHQMLSPDLDNRFLPTDDLGKWLEKAFNANKPWSKIVEELVTASGSMDTNPATLFYIGNSGPDKVTGQVSKLFLGVQLQCAQCHNHPFTDWKQDEYWGMAAFFTKVKQDGNPKKAAKDGSTISISENPPLAMPFGKGAKLPPKLAKKKKMEEIPEGFKVMPPKFLGGKEVKITGAARPVLAKWLTSTDNPYFARAMVNKTWAHFFGRGFVNPIDDMHDGNPATHPELLIAMGEQFKRHNYDLKYLVKSIVLSDTYQRSSKPAKGNEGDTEFFSRMYLRTLTGEQLFDSMVSIVGVPPGKIDFAAKKALPALAKKGGPKGPREQFITFFRNEDNADPLEYSDGIPQALRMMNAPITNKGGKTLDDAFRKKNPSEGINYLFLSVLSRPATSQETERFLGYVNKQQNLRTGLSDIQWTLLNCSEFRLNH